MYGVRTGTNFSPMDNLSPSRDASSRLCAWLNSSTSRADFSEVVPYRSASFSRRAIPAAPWSTMRSISGSRPSFFASKARCPWSFTRPRKFSEIPRASDVDRAPFSDFSRGERFFCVDRNLNARPAPAWTWPSVCVRPPIEPRRESVDTSDIFATNCQRCTSATAMRCCRANAPSSSWLSAYPMVRLRTAATAPPSDATPSTPPRPSGPSIEPRPPLRPDRTPLIPLAPARIFPRPLSSGADSSLPFRSA